MGLSETEQMPLKWPEGWPRTRHQDRQQRSAWKKSYQEAVLSLIKELKRSGITHYLITRNEARSEDSGVAVYFTLRPADDYGWQEALGFIGEVPTVAQIDRAYMERVKRVHPDGPTPDLVLFESLTKHRDTARKWARGERTVEMDKVMACDVFKEQRWNISAIRLTLAALRQIERCGSPMIMDRAWRGFAKALITGGARDEQATVA